MNEKFIPSPQNLQYLPFCLFVSTLLLSWVLQGMWHPISQCTVSVYSLEIRTPSKLYTTQHESGLMSQMHRV